MAKANAFLGSWRIVETELWESDDLDSLAPATLELGHNRQGYLAFMAIRAELDYRVGTRDGAPAVEFSFGGFDEGEEVMGRGWAVLEGARLQGRLFFHQGDDSGFVAERRQRPKSRTTPANTACSRQLG
jgi:hypothetical protein